jgi:GNAT superfamily N-acetyltransferase
MVIQDEVLLYAIETSMFWLPELPGKVEKLNIPGIRGRAIAGSDPFVSLAGVARLNSENADRAILQVVQHFEGQNKAFGWVTSPRSTPPALGERLDKIGMIPVVELAGMALTDLRIPIPTNPAVSIRQAVETDLEQASALLAPAIGFTPEGACATTEALLLGHGEGQARVYLAYMNGVNEPVGYASMITIPDQPIVVLYCAGVLEEYRGRGIYSSLVARRLADAYHAGARTAVIQAVRTTSAPICQKLGFIELLGMEWYIWEPEC